MLLVYIFGSLGICVGIVFMLGKWIRPSTASVVMGAFGVAFGSPQHHILAMIFIGSALKGTPGRIPRASEADILPAVLVLFFVVRLALAVVLGSKGMKGQPLRARIGSSLGYYLHLHAKVLPLAACMIVWFQSHEAAMLGFIIMPPYLMLSGLSFMYEFVVFRRLLVSAEEIPKQQMVMIPFPAWSARPVLLLSIGILVGAICLPVIPGIDYPLLLERLRAFGEFLTFVPRMLLRLF